VGRGRWSLLCALAVVVATAVPTLGGPATAASGATAATTEPGSGYLVYWDQNEEEDYYASATHTEAQLVTPWDPNGQMCLLNDGTGRFVVGYDPTNPSQHNPGGPPHHPFKQPPIGEELETRSGGFTGKNLFVPGPYHYQGGPGEDSPPDSHGVYNGQSTYTGCVVDAHHNVFADDIGTAQGSFPTPTDGRLVEWFAPSYTQSCILYGPTAGGVDGDHHVDGTGGLAQPGMLAWADNGDLLLPDAASPTGGLGGQVLEFDHSSFPENPSQCPGGVYPRETIKVTVWFQYTGTLLPVPMAVAKDPTCDCFAVDTAFGNPSIVWLSKDGTPIAGHPTVPGETLSQFGKPSSSGYNPFGMAFAPDGTLYFVDIHIICQGGNLGQCGPANNQGRVMQVSFPNGQPSAPQQIAGGFDFPTSVTLCVIGHGICPFPDHRTGPPSPGTKAEAG